MNAISPVSLDTAVAATHDRAPAIVFDAVSKSYPRRGTAPATTALDGVSLRIAAGEVFGIIGRSGAGKSTLIRLVNGLERPSAGRIVVDGTDITALSEAALRPIRRQLGMIFQHFNLLSSRTVFENVALPLELAGVPRSAIRGRVEDLLDLVGLTDKRARYPVELSGGQKQRVGIARALATDPKVLLSDEATSALDPETTRSILDLLRRVNAQTGVTILLITHEMAVVRAVCDRVAVFEQGRIVEEGAVAQVFASPRAAVTRSFVASAVGAALPEALAERVVAHPTFASRALLRITFTGEHATAPIISRLSRTLDIDVNIVAGQVEPVGRAPFGSLVVAIPAREDLVGAVTALVQQHGLKAELLGYVA